MAGEMDSKQTPVEPEEAVGNGENGAQCGQDCACHAGGAGGKAKLVVGQIVILIALVLVARAFVKGKEAAAQTGADAFSIAQVVDAGVADVETTSASSSRQQEGVVIATSEGESEAAVTPSAEAQTGQAVDASQPKQVVSGETIESLSDLNRKAAASDGVFVFLAGGDAEKAREAAAVLEKAAGKIRERGTKLDLFTLRNGSVEYRDLSAQVPPPGVVAMVKGRGAKTLSGDITEAKLLQAFLAASNASGCGPSGCGPAGCP